MRGACAPPRIRALQLLGAVIERPYRSVFCSTRNTMSDSPSSVDDLGLVGKAAIVTGGGAPDDGIGNGRAAAILLARAGARVLVVDIVPEAAEQTVAMIEKEGGTAAPFVAGVVDEGQCRALVDAALGRWGRLDLLDNN